VCQEAPVTRVFFAVDRELAEKSNLAELKYDDVLPIDVDRILSQNAIVVSDRVEPRGFPSPFVKGVLISNERSGQQEAILSHLRALLPQFEDDRLRFVDPAAALDLGAWMAGASAAYDARLVAQVARAEREVAELRLLYEKAQSVLFELEKHPGQPFMTRIVFQTLPGKTEARLGRTPVVATFAQELAAIHAIDIFISKRQTVLSNSELVVELAGARSGRRFATWRLLESAVKEGWNRFYCPIVEEPLGEPVALHVHVSASRAQSALVETSQESVSGVVITPPDQAAFAMRVWSGLVGVKLPRLDAGHLAEGEAPTALEADVSRRELLHLGAAYTEEQWPGQIAWTERDNGLMVHPAGRTPVVARIAGLQAVDIAAIRTSCKLAHASAAPTQFSIWIRRSGEVVKGADQAETAPHGGLFRRFMGARGAAAPVESGASEAPADAVWLTLTAGQEGELTLPIDPPHTGVFDLFLATRNLDKNNSYAWAVFTDLRFEQAPAQ
jgi:hypothetical protein